MDTLPPSLASGPPRLLGYRVEFFSASGRSAGWSAPAFTAAGAAPAPVEGLQASGSRLGTILAWQPSPQAGDVLLRREDLAPAHPPAPPVSHPGSTIGGARKPAHAPAADVVWMETDPTGHLVSLANRTLDTNALPDVAYRYRAQRRITLQLQGRSIDLRSSLSAPVTFMLREIYPPPAPTGLTAAGYFAGAVSSTFAVDLIWQPIDATGLLAGLAGYNIYREPLAVSGDPSAPRTRLNASPVPAPSFHDATASPNERLRYSVTAIDGKGNESPAAQTMLEPSPGQ